MHRKGRKESLDSWYHLSSLDHGILVLADLDFHELKRIAEATPYSMQINGYLHAIRLFMQWVNRDRSVGEHLS